MRKHELGKYKIITGDGMFLSPYYKGEGMYLGRGYYKPKTQRGVENKQLTGTHLSMLRPIKQHEM